jgi:hypothetical protein
MWAMARIPGRANELALYIAITSAPETVQGVPLHFLMIRFLETSVSISVFKAPREEVVLHAYFSGCSSL